MMAGTDKVVAVTVIVYGWTQVAGDELKSRQRSRSCDYLVDLRMAKKMMLMFKGT